MKRLAIKAAIKRASVKAREQAFTLDVNALAELEQIYAAALASMQARITAHADAGGRARMESMRTLRNELEVVHGELERQQAIALNRSMQQGARLGAGAFAEALDSEKISRVVDAAVKQTQQFIAADGLQLSDRVWRVNNGAREKVATAVQSAIIQGQSAAEAASDFLQRGQTVPVELQAKINGANASAIAKSVGDIMVNNDDSARANAKRIFRTEINRAHGNAYQAAAFEDEDVIGTRFLLSPNHPEPDICDMHAKANIYGLGAGVYPKNKSPWPAHPNTLSYVEVVFADEVTAADRAGRESRSAWLGQQSVTVQQLVLNSRKKQHLFAAGKLNENAFVTPWRVLKKRFDDFDFTVPAPVTTPANPLPPIVANRFKTKVAAQNYLQTHYADSVNLNGASLAGLNSIIAGLDKTLGAYGMRIGTLGWKSRDNPHSIGVYSWPAMGWRPGSDTIGIKRAYVIGDFKYEPENQLRYMARRELKIEQMQARLKDYAGTSQEALLRRSLAYVQASTRWSAKAVLDDPVAAVVAHEVGHAIMAQRNNFMAWRGALAKHGVEKIDWYRVSEYAGTDEEELFAEVTAFLAAGRENLLPKKIVNAYREVLEDSNAK